MNDKPLLTYRATAMYGDGTVHLILHPNDDGATKSQQVTLPRGAGYADANVVMVQAMVAAASTAAGDGGSVRLTKQESRMLGSCLSYLDQDENICAMAECTEEEWDALCAKFGAATPPDLKGFANVKSST